MADCCVYVISYWLCRSNNYSRFEWDYDAYAYGTSLCWFLLQLLATLRSFSLNDSNVQLVAFAPSYTVSVGNCIFLSRHFILRFCCRNRIKVLFLNLSLLILEFRLFWENCSNVLVKRRITYVGLSYTFWILGRLLWNGWCTLCNHCQV